MLAIGALAPAVALGQVTYLTTGTSSGVTAATVTPGIPVGVVQDDVLVAVLHSRTNTAHSCTANCTGWTIVGTQAGDATGGRVSVWWLRVGATAPADPTFGGPATESYVAKIWAFRGTVSAGSPFDVVGTNTTQASSTTFTGQNLTTTVANAMVVFVGGSMDNNGWGPAGGSVDTPASGDNNCTTQNFCFANSAGTDNSVFLAYDSTPDGAPGAPGAPTMTQSNLGPDAGRWLTFAFRPGAPPVPGTPAASNSTTTGMDVSWTASSGATSYTLEVDDENTFSVPLTASYTPATNSQAVSGLTANTLYYLRANATNGGGTSGWSPTGQGTTLSNAPGTPSFSGTTSTQTTVTWTAPAGNGPASLTYTLDRAEDAGFTVGLVSTTGISGTSTTASGLTPGVTYWFRVKAVNAGGTSADSPSATVTTTATTTVGNGTDPSSATRAPGAAVTPLDAFTLQTSGGTDVVTAATVTLSAGSAAGLSRVGIWSGSTCTGTEYGFASNPATDAVAVTLGTTITATTTATPYHVCVTPKSHAAMPAPPGSAYAVTGTITSITSTNAKSYGDSGSATVTVDNLSPANVTGLSATPGDTQVTLSWTNPADADFSQVLVLRSTSTVVAVPVEGQTYVAGNTIGAATVAYAGASPPQTVGSLTNGQIYYFRLFSRDTSGNYSQTGVETSATPTAAAATLTIGNGSAEPPSQNLNQGQTLALDAFSLQTSTGTATVTAVSVSLTNGTALSAISINSASNCGGTTHGTRASPVNGNNSIATAGLSANTGSGGTNLYVCATGGTVGSATAVTGNVASVTAAGFTPTDADTTNATLTVQPPAVAITTVGNGTDPGSATVAPGSPIRALDAFTLQTSTGTDPVTSATVTLAAGTWAGLSALSVNSAAACNGTSYGSVEPYTDATTIPLSGLTATTTLASYWICVTPRTHAAMPPPPGASYAVTGTVTAILSGNTKSYADSGSATITVDNRSPANAVWGAITPAATQITLAWTNPADADFSQVVILRSLSAGPVADVPVEGGTYTAGSNYGTSRVVYAGAASPQTDTGLSTNTAYYYKVFARDSNGNFATGVALGPVYTGTNPLPVGDGTGGTTLPMVSIVNPGNGSVVSGPFRVQVRVWSPSAAIGAVQVTSNAGGAWSALAKVAAYGGSASSGVWETQVSLAAGSSYTLVARAENGGAWVNSAPVGVVVKAAGTGDGRLLVRDNSSQLCTDCHAMATHSSEAVGTSYGSWAAVCRDCHTAHGTTNIFLVRQQITPPPLGASIPAAKDVTFLRKTELANASNTGPCQVCHTRTQYYRADGSSPGGAHSTGDCSSCHAHTQGLKASCTSCHGTEGRVGIAGADSLQPAAPPAVATGATVFVANGGAHLAHVNQASWRTNPFACAECHATPNTHQGTTDVTWNTLATGGGTVGVSPTAGALTGVWAATPNCTNYCHGAGLAGGGGAVPTPSWNGPAAHGACGACHASPPPVSAVAANDHPQNVTCSACHGTGYTQASLDVVAKVTHLDGTIQRPANGCTACHGVLAGLAGAAVPNTSMEAAPGYVGGTTGVSTSGASAVTNVRVGAHDAHVRPSGSLGAVNAFDCSVCHGTKPADGTTTHANGTIAVGWGTPANSGGVTPTPAAFDATFEATPNCTNYCHSNASPLGGSSSTPAFSWTSTTNLTCTSCHGTGNGASTTLSAVHGKHVNATGSAGYAFTCDECHANVISNDSRTSIGTLANHVDGTKTWQFSTTLRTTSLNQSGGTYSGSPGYTCASTYCHSGGVATASPFSATASAAISWNGGTSTCRSCHGWDAAAAPTIGVAAGSSFQGSANHAGHVANAAVIGTNYLCGDCHATVVAAGTNSPLTSLTLHVNGTKNVSIANRGTYASTDTTSTCSATYCHSSGQQTPTYRTIAWSGAAIGCAGCHGQGNTAGSPDYANGGAGAATANSHAAHTSNGTNPASCQNCHSGVVTAAGTAIASGSTLHTNGARNIAILATYDTNGGSSNYTPATKTCNNVSCHGSATPQWGATLGCNSCHGNTGPARTPVAGADANLEAAPPVGLAGETLTTTRAVGAHIAHANQITLRSSAIACAECHSGATHEGTKQVVFGTIATTGGRTPTWNGTTCASTYCHAPGGTEVGGSIRSPNWTSGVSQQACGTCHAAPPPVSVAAAEDHPQNTTCANCHGTGYATTGVTSTAKATHVNQSVTGGVDKPNNGCTACHGVLAGVAGASVPNTSMTAAPGHGGTGVSTSGASAATNVRVGAHDAHVRPAGSLNSASPFDCSTCHGTKPPNLDTTHANATIGIGWAAPANSGGVTPTPAAFNTTWEATPNCTNYCHSNASPTGAGTNQLATVSWTDTADRTCTSCHSNIGRDQTGGVATSLSQKHGKHLNGTTYAYTCDECHATVVQNDSSTVIGTPANHVNATKNVAFSTTMKATTINQSAGTYSAAAGTCASTYCHSGGVATAAPFSATASAALVWPTGTSSCRNCHGWNSAAAPTIGVSAGSSFQGSANHMGHVSNAGVIGTNYFCGDCHATVVAAGTDSPITTFGNHVNGTKNVSIANRGTQASGAYNSGTQTCASNYCHSSGQQTPTYRTITWGGAALSCNGCHGQGNATGAPDYANGGAGASTANSHAAHTSNGTSPTSCQNCHSGFVNAAGTAIAGSNHTNGTRNVAILAAYDTNGATPNYTAATKTCNSVSCHGTSTPQWGATLGCSSCHGGAADLNDWNIANGTVSIINTGTEWTTYGHGSTNATFSEFTGATDRCVYCHDGSAAHGLSTNPFRLRGAAASNGTTAAYSSATPATTIAVCLNCHSESATVAYGVDPDAVGSGQPKVGPATDRISAYHYGAKHLATQDGGQRCWDCHDPHGDATNLAMIGADMLQDGTDVHGLAGTRVTGTVLTSRAAGGYANTTTRNGVCQKCHTTTSYWRFNAEPTAHNAGTNCISCHAHQQPPDLAFKGAGSCIDCHSSRTGSIPRAQIAGGTAGNEGDDFIRASRHVSNGTTTSIVTNYDCILCHTEGDVTSTGSGPTANIKTIAANHGGDGGTTSVDLRNVDSAGGTGIEVAWPGRRLASFTANTTQRDAMDRFCMNCHDSNGASTVAVNKNNPPDGMLHSGTTLPTAVSFGGTTANLRPFNQADNARNAREAAGLQTWRTTTNLGRVIDVKSQFNSGNLTGKNFASHHNLNQFTKRYTTNNLTHLPNTVWTAYVTKEGVTLNSGAANAGVVAGLHCSDCHLNEVNAHGTRNTWYMLANSSFSDASADAAFTNTGFPTGTENCMRCHDPQAYGEGGTNSTSGPRSDAHDGDCGRVDGLQMYSNTGSTLGRPTSGTQHEIPCLGCHGGLAPGMIHGTNSTYNPWKGAGTSKRYRFMGTGGSMRWYSPTGAAYSADTDWEQNVSMGCYTLGTSPDLADTWGGCTQHNSGRSGNAVNRARPLQY